MTVGQDDNLNTWATSQYDAVSKALFDAQDNVDLVKTVETADSFNEGVVDILRNAGVPDKFLKGVGGEDVGTTEWKAAVESMAGAGAELAMDTAIGGLLTYIGKPDWIPAATSAAHKLSGHFSQMNADANEAKLELLNPGQWVVVNNGPPPEPELGYKDELRRRRLFGATPPPPDQISAGFYVGPASAPAYVTVFNFFSFKKEDHRIENVAVANELKTLELEGNSIMKQVRDLFFAQQEPPAKMNSEVPTDPGTEVIYNELLYHIVKSEGSEALIEDVHGQRKVVSIDKLLRGRVTHTNSWNYRKGEIFNTGFDSDGSAKNFTGQWVWIPARQDLVDAGVTPFELAVIWKIERDGVYTFNAFDGDLVVVDDYPTPVNPILADSFNLRKKFVKFRLAAVEGVNTHTYCLGSDELLICIGGTQDEQVGWPKPETPGERVIHQETLMPAVFETVGDEALVTAVDNAEEIQRDTEVSSGVVLKDILLDDGVPEIREGGNNLLVFGAMTAAVLFLYNSIEGL